jgi:hypothetical protein
VLFGNLEALFFFFGQFVFFIQHQISYIGNIIEPFAEKISSQGTRLFLYFALSL